MEKREIHSAKYISLYFFKLTYREFGIFIAGMLLALVLIYIYLKYWNSFLGIFSFHKYCLDNATDYWTFFGVMIGVAILFATIYFPLVFNIQNFRWKIISIVIGIVAIAFFIILVCLYSGYGPNCLETKRSDNSFLPKKDTSIIKNPDFPIVDEVPVVNSDSQIGGSNQHRPPIKILQPTQKEIKSENGDLPSEAYVVVGYTDDSTMNSSIDKPYLINERGALSLSDLRIDNTLMVNKLTNLYNNPIPEQQHPGSLKEGTKIKVLSNPSYVRQYNSIVIKIKILN